MSFSNRGCVYRNGIIVTDPTPAVFGDVICNLTYKGQSYPFDGSWSLGR